MSYSHPVSYLCFTGHDKFMCLTSLISLVLCVVQDPGTPAAKRVWTSIDTGTEIFVSDKDEVAEWTLSDFDVILTQPTDQNGLRLY